MAQKSVKKNFIFNLIYRLIVLVAPLITMPYVSRVLGVSNIGLYSYSYSIVSYFVLVAGLGTATFGNRQIGYTQNNPEERSRSFWEIFIFRAIMSTVTLTVYLVTFTLIYRDNWLIYLILGLYLVDVFVDVSWFLQGMEEFGKTVSINILFKILNIVLTLTLVKTANDLWIYVLLLGFGVAGGNLSMWVYMPKYLVKVKGIKPFRNIKDILILFIPSIAVQVYTVLDKSMIGWFAGGDTVENGYYEQAEKVIRMATTIVTALGTVMIPRMARKYAEGDTEYIKWAMYRSYRFGWMLALPLMFGLIAVASVFVPVFFGDGYEKCALLIMVFSPLNIIIGMSNATGLQYLIPTGRQHIYTISVVTGAVVNVILNLILIPLYFSLGATIASVAAETCGAVVQLAYIRITKQFELKPVFTCWFKYAIASGIMCGALFGIKYFLPVTWWSLAILVIGGVIIYFLLLLIMRDKMFMEGLEKGLAIVKHVLHIKPKHSEEEKVEPVEDVVEPVEAVESAEPVAVAGDPAVEPSPDPAAESADKAEEPRTSGSGEPFGSPEEK